MSKICEEKTIQIKELENEFLYLEKNKNNKINRINKIIKRNN